jgi:hypothetical protein
MQGPNSLPSYRNKLYSEHYFRYLLLRATALQLKNCDIRWQEQIKQKLSRNNQVTMIQLDCPLLKKPKQKR